MPLAQAGLTTALTSAGTALGVAQPQLIPIIAPSVATLSALGSSYLADPSSYQGYKKSSSLAKEYAKDQALQQLNSHLGTNMGNLSRASLDKAVSDKASAELAKYAIEARQMMPPSYDTGMSGMGLYAGAGLTAGGSLGTGLYLSNVRRTGGAIGLNGGFVGRLPPALQSQPFSANFQFQNTLPPAYQRFSKGSGLYA